MSRTRARTLQLKIASDNIELEDLIWQAFLGLESYLELRAPFNALEYFIKNGGAAVIQPPAPLILPPNAPPAMVNQLWNQVAQSAINALTQPPVEVDYSLINAVIESTRVASEYRTNGSLSASRMGSGEVQLSATDKATGWTKVEAE